MQNTKYTLNTEVKLSYIDEIMSVYERAVEAVNRGPVKLGWNTEVYPNREFVQTAIENGWMVTLMDEEKVVGTSVINYNVIPEYDLVPWQVAEPKEKISTIHALAIDPSLWGTGCSEQFVTMILDYCKSQGDIANHMDVIDTNSFAKSLYLKCGFTCVQELDMYYEVVGTRSFSMMEYVF